MSRHHSHHKRAHYVHKAVASLLGESRARELMVGYEDGPRSEPPLSPHERWLLERRSRGRRAATSGD